MAVEVVTGPPFGGKAQFAREQIARREADGELGLVMLDWTALYLAMFPGAQSAFRDEAIGETGAPRMTGYTFEVVAAAIAARELSGYVLTQSPERAIALADRFDGPLLEVSADVGDVADRADEHMTRLRRTVSPGGPFGHAAAVPSSGRVLLSPVAPADRAGEGSNDGPAAATRWAKSNGRSTGRYGKRD